jgi:hypothetical protein
MGPAGKAFDPGPGGASFELESDGITNPALGETLKGLLRRPDPGENFLETIIPNFVTLGFIIASVVFIFFFIWGGISWITSGGDKAQVQTARDRITSAIVGMVILLAMYAIIQVVELFFHTNIINLDISVLKIQ